MEIDDKKIRICPIHCITTDSTRGFLLKKNYFGEKETVWISRKISMVIVCFKMFGIKKMEWLKN